MNADAATRRPKPVGTDYDPTGDDLTSQEAVNRISALLERASRECYLPEEPRRNTLNAGRVRALAQAMTLLERAGLEPEDGALELTRDEVMR